MDNESENNMSENQEIASQLIALAAKLMGWEIEVRATEDNELVAGLYIFDPDVKQESLISGGIYSHSSSTDSKEEPDESI